MADLTAEQLEQFTDVMVGKLAMIRTVNAPVGELADKLRRDEIQQVIADTYVLLSADDVGAELERWMAES